MQEVPTFPPKRRNIFNVGKIDEGNQFWLETYTPDVETQKRKRKDNQRRKRGR